MVARAISIRTLALALILALAMAPSLASAQDDGTNESEPTVNESDFNTTSPEYDESYLDDHESANSTDDTSQSTSSEADTTDSPDADNSSTEEPTLEESDFNMSAPEYDDSYLDEYDSADDTAGTGGADDGSAPATDSAAGTQDTKARTPGFGPALVAISAALVGLALRRRA